MPKKIAAGKFKAQCLGIIDEVQAKRQTYIITKRGKPMAQLIPVESQTDDIFGFYKGKLKITGDVVAPAFSPEEWGDLYAHDRHPHSRLAGGRRKQDLAKSKHLDGGGSSRRREPGRLKRHTS